MNLYIVLLCLYVSSLFGYIHINQPIKFSLNSKRKNIELNDETKKNKELYTPKSLNQEKYVEYLENRNISIVIGIGPAGSGKTLFACSNAVKELKSGNIDHIIITRPLISVDEELGFLPGSLEEKMDPWTRPIIDTLSEYYTPFQIKTMLKNKIIEISPLAFMRGRTFKRSFIIADEMQNSSPNQMKMMLTRLGEHSRMAVTGDLKQSDRPDENGLIDFITRLNQFDNKNSTRIKYIEFKNEDIQRSETVRQLLEIYDKPIFEKKSTIKNDGIKMEHFSKNTTENNDAAMIPKHQYDIGHY